MSRYPLEGYRERCATDVVLGARYASKPIELAIPITIAGMSFGALSRRRRRRWDVAHRVGTSTTTGDGGMTDEERLHSKTLVYQVLPSRYGMNPAICARPTTIESRRRGRQIAGGSSRSGRAAPGRRASSVQALLVGHPAVAVVVLVPTSVAPVPAPFACAESAPNSSGDRDRDRKLDRCWRSARRARRRWRSARGSPRAVARHAGPQNRSHRSAGPALGPPTGMS